MAPSLLFPAGVDWHSITGDEAVRRLIVDPARGLDASEAAARFARTGPNVIERIRRVRWTTVLLRQFTSTLIVILIVAAGISALLGEAADAVTILTIVVLNGILGFIQEWRAERAIEALQRMLSPRCSVLRGGVAREVEASALVPGDVVPLKMGDRVSADIRILDSANLQADESVLTGESEPVPKGADPVEGDAALPERRSIVWMGTSVTDGRARGVVVATGMDTEFGRIAKLTQTIEREPTPLQRRLGLLGRQLGILSVTLAVAIAAAGWATGKELLEMFMTAVSLAVAVVPEGLPAVVTITLAIGIRAMARKRALLRRLQAAEGLGTASVICTDKTGTLTENEMTVQKIWLPAGTIDVTGSGYDPAGHFEQESSPVDYRARPDLLALLTAGLRCTHASLRKEADGWHPYGEPTEAAVIVAAYKAWLAPGNDGAVTEFSFTSARKRMTVIHTESGRPVAHIKGAPEVILERCSRILLDGEERPLTKQARTEAQAAYEGLAGTGLRTLAFARRILEDSDGGPDDVECDLTLLGLMAMIDPPRPEVPDAIRIAREAGIRVIMITGDAAPTAKAISAQIGMKVERVVQGAELDGTSDASLRDLLDREVLFARTTPEHKLRIVEMLQTMGEVAAMTGDGVNDAPALKRADIGVAMGRRGTDVARGVADIVLTDDNFASIVSAVEEGRRQYDNIQKFVRYLLSSNVAEIIAILTNIVLGGPLILLPVQILWVNLVTDGATAVALGAERAERGLMQRPPRARAAAILDPAGMLTIFVIGLYMGAGTLLLFNLYLPSGEEYARTVALTGLIVMEMVNVFNFRTLRRPLTSIGIFTNRWLWLAWGLTFALQLAVIYVPFLQQTFHTVPLGGAEWVWIAALSLPVFVAFETIKHLRRAG